MLWSQPVHLGEGEGAFSFVLDSECIPEHTHCELGTRGYLALGEEREAENARGEG